MPNTDLNTIIAKLKEAQPHLREQYGVSALWVFGSYVRGEQSQNSDVDVLVEFERPGMTLFKFVDLEMHLTDLLGVEVDLVRRAALRQRIRPAVLNEAIAV